MWWWIFFSTPLQAWHVDWPKAKRSRKLSNLVCCKSCLRKNIGHLKVGANMLKVVIAHYDAVPNIVIVHVDVLSTGIKDQIPS
jgi:hypothetical protein